MHVSIRRYRIEPGKMPEITRRIEESFLPLLRELPGFVSYQVVDCGDGFMASISTFETRQAAEQSREAAADWVREHMAGFLSGIPDVMTGQILLEVS